MYFKDGQVRASYTIADGLGKGHVPGLRLDQQWSAVGWNMRAGLAALKTATSLPSQRTMVCPATPFIGRLKTTIVALWLYTVCGLVRITRTELDAWIDDPKRRVETTVWDAADGVGLALHFACLLQSSCREVQRRQIVVHTGEGDSSRRSPSCCFQQSSAAGTHRADRGRQQDVLAELARPGSSEPASASANSRFQDRLLRSQPGGARRRFTSSTSSRARTATGER